MNIYNVFDSIIIGAGLAGLSAASHLQEFRVLLLERESLLGGRIVTRSFDGKAYDLGAVLGYDPGYLPFAFSPPAPIAEKGQIGLLSEGRVYLGDSVAACLQAAFPGPSQELATMLALQAGNIEIHALSPKARNVLNAFFQVIHPGEIEDYLPAFQAHAFFRYRPVHYPDGNGGLIQAYLERIRARVECGAEVISIQKTGQHICLSFKQHGQVMEAHARSVIVATPAPIAAALVPDMREQCRRFLQAVCYGRFTVAALGLCRFSCEQDFSYIVTPALPATTIYKMTFPGSAMTILLFYYCDRASKAYWQASDEDLITLTKECAARAGLKIVEPDLLFTDVARWEHGGTIISPEMYSDWNADALQPVPGIYLAGDYLYRDFPYGMEAAVRSGIEIAQQVRSFLRRKL